AADACRGIHGQIGIAFWDGNGIPVGTASGGSCDETAAGDDAVESAAVHDEVTYHRERPGTPGFQIQNIPVLEFPHVKLAHRSSTLRPMRDAIDHESARAADSFAAIVVESHRLSALYRQFFI